MGNQYLLNSIITGGESVKQNALFAYHPESLSALVGFHQTLENMVKSYCFDTERNLDEGINFLLFAVRNSVI